MSNQRENPLRGGAGVVNLLTFLCIYVPLSRGASRLN